MYFALTPQALHSSFLLPIFFIISLQVTKLVISLQVTKLVSIWGLANEKLNGCASYMHIQKLNKFIRHGFIVVGWYLHPISLAMHDYISIDAHHSVATIIFGIET